MTLMYVDAEALNLRSQPIVTPDNRIALLHAGQQLEMLEEAGQAGWALERHVARVRWGAGSGLRPPNLIKTCELSQGIR